MAKVPANPNSRVYFDEFDLSGVLNSTSLDVDQSTPVTTGLGTTGPRRVPGGYDVKASDLGFLEPTDDGYDEQLFAALTDGADHYLTKLFGANAMGSPSYDMVVKVSSQPRSASIGGAILLNFESEGSEGVARGLVLGHKTTTGAEDLTAYNQGPTLLTEYDETLVDTDHLVGAAGANTERGQGFQCTDARLGEVRLWLKKIAAPEDNITAEIQTDDGGKPSGTAINNGTSTAIDGATLGAGYAWIRFHFPGRPNLVEGTQYHVILRRSAAVDAVNHYAWGDDASAPAYAYGVASIYNGAAWAADAGNDLSFQVYNWCGDTYAATFRVLTFDGTDITLKVEHDPAEGGGYAAIAGLTATFTDIGVERDTTAAVLDDWRRVAITGDFTSALILVTAGVVQAG